MSELIVALDVPDAREAMNFATILKGAVSWVKVGLELFIASGPAIVERLKANEFRVFLDLKLYDIPNTVAHAVKSAQKAGADMLTVHLQGGLRMCSAAREASLPEGRPLLLGVTALTSFGAGEMPGIGIGPSQFGLELAALANKCGLPGVICSGFEAAAIKGAFPDLLCVCPGIRPDSALADDQRRAMTPGEASRAGADFLVVGRPILRAADPRVAAIAILQEIEGSS